MSAGFPLALPITLDGLLARVFLKTFAMVCVRACPPDRQREKTRLSANRPFIIPIHCPLSTVRLVIVMFRMRKIVFVIYGIWLSACSQAVAQAQIEGADRVLLNGKIYTVDAAKPWAEAVAIRDGRFVFVGDNSGAREFIGNSTVVSDLGGHLVIPGIIENQRGQINLIHYSWRRHWKIRSS